jgi:4'-phosphopantetheinyl transferase
MLLNPTMQHLALPEIIPSGVEVWLLKLNLEMPLSSLDLALLSEDERTRALRFRRHEDRVRSVATRAALRRLLARRVMRRPEKLDFIVNQHGKPRLSEDLGIEFNVSHTACFALIALSASGQIGVDIEWRDRQIDTESLGAYVFTPLERRSALRMGGKAEDFIERWVAKESVLKALGLGISEHLQAVSILAGAGEGYEITHSHPEWADIKAWPIEVPDGYAAALAMKSPASFYPHKVFP